MYNVNAVSFQNIYAPLAAARSSLKKDGSASIDTVFTTLAAEKYAGSDSSVITAEVFYAPRVGNDDKEKNILDELTAAGIFKTKEEEEEEEKAVDELLKAIKEHQKTWKAEMYGIKKNELTVEEVEEVLSGLKCTNRAAV